MNAASGSTSVRDGGRARVYVYGFLSAAESAVLHSSGVAVEAPAPAAADWMPCASAEKKILAARQS
jgi:hypothetical protein